MADYEVVLLPSFTQVENWRKRHADKRDSGVFGQVVSTFDAWIADLWELHGDGRSLVGAVQREVLMRSAFEEVDALFDGPGFASMAASLMSKVAGVPSFEDAIDALERGEELGVSSGERAFLQAIARYERILDALGLVEAGQAAAVIAAGEAPAIPHGLRVLVSDVVSLTPMQRHFFERCDRMEVRIERAAGFDGITRAPEGIDVSFAFPSGKLAEPGLVADLVVESALSGDVVVACADPLDLFARVRERLSAAGLNVCVQARKRFSQTDFGCAFLAMVRSLHSEPWDREALTDVLMSPFSGMSRADAFAVDASIRADRVLAREDALARLRAASEPFSQLEEIASDPDADVLIGVFEQMIQASMQRSATWRSEQLSAMRALRDATSAARRVGASIESCASVLERVSVPVSAQITGQGATVVISSQEACAQMPAGCCVTLIVADLTAEDCPVANRDDASSTLLASLGIESGEDALARARSRFCALLRLPTQRLRVVRPLNAADASESYPAIVLEEFVDAYRDDRSAFDDIDNAYRIPARLQVGLRERGEELLFANARAAEQSRRQSAQATVRYPQLADIDERQAGMVLPVRRDSTGATLARPCPSPSQIETYLECPYRWFATRRLRVDTLDEGFGPLERGTFAHAALERFYRHFQDAGFAKVSADNLPRARELMEQVASELVEAQFSGEPKGGRLVYATELERREVAALCSQLVSYLDLEARLLPTFRPAYFEYSIDADHAVDYAGYSLVGTIDRIDVDDRGRAVVIDYKGSVNAEHEIGGKDANHAGKVQTRIYAQVVKRALGLDVVGALYVSYGRRHAVSGAYDSRVLEAAHLPEMRHDHCACGSVEEMPLGELAEASFEGLSFDRMLDLTEAVAGEAIEAMAAGAVRPSPSYAQACAFCPVLSCPKRGE